MHLPAASHHTRNTTCTRSAESRPPPILPAAQATGIRIQISARLGYHGTRQSEGLVCRAQLLMSVGLGMGMALEHAQSHLIHKCDLLSMETSA